MNNIKGFFKYLGLLALGISLMFVCHIPGVILAKSAEKLFGFYPEGFFVFLSGFFLAYMLWEYKSFAKLLISLSIYHLVSDCVEYLKWDISHLETLCLQLLLALPFIIFMETKGHGYYERIHNYKRINTKRKFVTTVNQV